MLICISMRLVAVFLVTCVAALVVSSRSDASARFDSTSVYFRIHQPNDPTTDAIPVPSRTAEALPVSCSEAQAYAAAHGPQETVREARRRKLTWAQIKRVKLECFDRAALLAPATQTPAGR